jgi:hypothetical protein
MAKIAAEKKNIPSIFRNPRFYLILFLILGLILAGFFALRAFHGFQHMRSNKFGGGESNVELIRGWMTVDYITKMYHVPPDVVLSPLNLPVEGNEKRSLESLIRSTRTSDPAGLLQKIKDNINQFQQKDLMPTHSKSQPLQEHP